VKPRRATRDQVRLLRCAPSDLVATPRARAFLKEHETAPTSEPEQRITTDVISFTEADFLRERGVNVESKANADLRTARDALNAYVMTGRGQPIDGASMPQTLVALRRLRHALKSSGLNKDQAWFGWDVLMEACERFAVTKALPNSVFRLVQTCIIECLRFPGPTWDDNFDQHGSYGGPAPHVPAASAAMYLYANNPKRTSPDLIKLAAADSSRPARARVAHLLAFIQAGDADLMWRIAESFARHDRSAGVAQAIASSLGRLIWLNPDRGSKLLWTLYQRSVKRDWKAARDACESLFLWRYLVGDRKAAKVVDSTLNGRRERVDEIKKMLFALRSYVRSEDAGLRSSAVSLIERAASLFASDYAEVVRDESSATIETAHPVFTNLVEFATELYFASGAYVGAGGVETEPTPEEVAFFDAIYPTLQRVRDVGIPAAVHKLLEMLEHFIDVRPERVYDLVVDLIKAGSTQQFQYEYMGAEIAVRIMEDYLSAHRNVIESTKSRREAFLKTLDLFALWPNAVRIIYRFDEAFR